MVSVDGAHGVRRFGNIVGLSRSIMKNTLIAALLLSTAALSAPVFAQGNVSTTIGDSALTASDNAPLTRADVRAQLAAAQANGMSPQSFGRRDTAYLYGAAQRAALAH